LPQGILQLFTELKKKLNNRKNEGKVEDHQDFPQRRNHCQSFPLEDEEKSEIPRKTNLMKKMKLIQETTNEDNIEEEEPRILAFPIEPSTTELFISEPMEILEETQKRKVMKRSTNYSKLFYKIQTYYISIPMPLEYL